MHLKVFTIQIKLYMLHPITINYTFVEVSYSLSYLIFIETIINTIL